MPISSGCVDHPAIEVFEDVSVRRILAFAAGIGDTSSPVFDDAADGLVAPPSYCVSLEWPLLSHPELHDVLGARPDELVRAVHASQDSVFHTPITAGIRLRSSGRVTGLRATRAGALATIQVVTCRADDSRPVVTSWLESVYRGVAIDGEPKVLASPPEVPSLPTETGRESALEIPIARELPHVYSECARIWNPIHTERRVAEAAGLPDIILHGTASWSLAGREIVARYAAGDPTRLRRLHGRFRAMVIPGTLVTLRHRVVPGPDGKTRVAFRLLNAEGEEAIRDGFAELS